MMHGGNVACLVVLHHVGVLSHTRGHLALPYTTVSNCWPIPVEWGGMMVEHK